MSGVTFHLVSINHILDGLGLVHWESYECGWLWVNSNVAATHLLAYLAWGWCRVTKIGSISRCYVNCVSNQKVLIRSKIQIFTPLKFSGLIGSESTPLFQVLSRFGRFILFLLLRQVAMQVTSREDKKVNTPKNNLSNNRPNQFSSLTDKFINKHRVLWKVNKHK